MLRQTDDPPRQVEKLTRINEALIQRLERMDDVRGSSYALTRTAAMLEREVLARNADLERALAELGARNEELAAAREMADEANRAKSRFLRAASHDLLQPLSAGRLFLGQLGDLATDAGAGRPRAAGQRLVRERRGADPGAPRHRTARQPEVRGQPGAGGGQPAVPAAGDRPAPAGGGARIDLRFVPSSEAVLSDPVLLRQIAQNLIINALKYSTGPKVVVGLKHDGPTPG